MSEENVARVGRERLVLGFDAGCMSCSDLARRIEEQAGDKLEVRSLSDPRVEHWRKQALGEDAPWAPTLIEIRNGQVKAWIGLRMGVVLSRKLGPSATWRIMQVLGELRSTSRSEDRSREGETVGGLSRRRFLKGLAGGLVAFSVLPAGEALAAGRQGTEVSKATHVPANSSAIARLKGFRSVRAVDSSFGTPNWNKVVKAKYKDAGQERSFFAVPYRSRATSAAAGTAFLIAEDEASLGDAHSIVVRTRRAGNKRGYIDYYHANGTPLAKFEVKNGRAEALPAEEIMASPEFQSRCSRASTQRSADQVAPDQACRPGFIRCFLSCAGPHLSIGCALECATCVTPPGHPVDCARCFVCAGSVGLRYARLCG